MDETSRKDSERLSKNEGPRKPPVPIYIYIYIYISEVGGVSPTGKPFRFVSCVRARGGGEVGFGWFWDSTG